MNLIARVTVVFVIASLIIFLIGGTMSYNAMMDEVMLEQQQFLVKRLKRLERMLNHRPPTDTIKWSKVRVIPLPNLVEERLAFSDTVIMHSELERLEPHLKLDAVLNSNGKSYAISVFDVTIKTDDIRDGLVESLFTMYLVLLGLVLIFGFLASYFLLRPFNNTLSIIKNFSLTNPDSSMSFPKTQVKEFRRLNEFLSEMGRKVKSDYQSLKEFSENASHELQTPIAVVQSKLEVLMDAENLKEDQINQIHSAHNAVRRLSNLSNSLSLITKIDNNEFVNVSDINLSEALNGMIEEFKELMALKSIQTEISIVDGVRIKADKILIELLLTNIINNAIRHNCKQGSIEIELSNQYLRVKNSGAPLSVPPSELFRRFKKSNQSAQSLGLGLAIVKRIVDLYNYKVDYHNEGNMHTIQITF